MFYLIFDLSDSLEMRKLACALDAAQPKLKAAASCRTSKRFALLLSTTAAEHLYKLESIYL